MRKQNFDQQKCSSGSVLLKRGLVPRKVWACELLCSKKEKWCPGGESNPHEVKPRRILSYIRVENKALVGGMPRQWAIQSVLSVENKMINVRPKLFDDVEDSIQSDLRDPLLARLRPRSLSRGVI